jgi:2-polyprenyl-3-methyl-5-hydroxy-6-metoxy-1,4-benzoquinol methylase
MDERVQNIIDSHAFSTMLDLGAGTGRFSLYAASKGINVTAVEKQENYLSGMEKIAFFSKGKEIGSVRYLVEDLERWLPEESYDFILAKNILQFLPKEYVLHTLLPRLIEKGDIVYIETFGDKEVLNVPTKYSVKDFPFSHTKAWEEDSRKMNGDPHHFHMVSALYVKNKD